jgi:hypothetical protein
VTTGATVNNWQILSVDGNWFAGTTEAPACSSLEHFLILVIWLAHPIQN